MAVKPDDIVPSWYNSKTTSIIEKYGPGPRIHFHMGLVDTYEPLPDAGSIKVAMVESQHRMMDRAATAWRFDHAPPRDVLDVGCGLGGGSIYWAERYHARIDALTITQDHLPIIDDCSSTANVRKLIKPIYGDAHTFATTTKYDTVVAFESSCYFDRFAWFDNLSRLTSIGTRVGIEDAFLVDESWRRPFDDYWHTRIEMVRHYVEAAERAGFGLVSNVDVTTGAIGFWTLSIDWNNATISRLGKDDQEHGRLHKSNEWHGLFRRALETRGCEVRLLMFEKVTP